MKSFSTTIKKKYWEMKLEDLKTQSYFWEYKAFNKFWTKRITGLITPCPAIFLVGNKVSRMVCVEIRGLQTKDIPQRYQDPIFGKYIYGLRMKFHETLLLEAYQKAVTTFEEMGAALTTVANAKSYHHQNKPKEAVNWKKKKMLENGKSSKRKKKKIWKNPHWAKPKPE